MQRFLSGILSVVFLLWLLPLGVFIVPSKEKSFCDGQRAICLCSHHSALAPKADSGKVIVKINGGVPKEETSSFGASLYDTSAHLLRRPNLQAFNYFLRQKNLYRLLLVCPIEHVPKT